MCTHIYSYTYIYIYIYTHDVCHIAQLSSGLVTPDSDRDNFLHYMCSKGWRGPGTPFL